MSDSVELLKQKAAQGNNDARQQLGELYFWGQPQQGIARNPELAQQHFEAAAVNGNPHAQYNLGLLLIQGNAGEYGNTTNVTRGVELLN